MTGTWYFLPLGDGIMANEPSEEIRAIFLPLFNASNQHGDMAVFTRNESQGRLHCEVIAYFSPSAAAVAHAMDAEPCERPERSGLGLLVGNEASWSILFPEIKP